MTKTARKLRKNLTRAEKILWYYLKNKQLNGIKFRRQQQIGNYIVDFYCAEKKIVIELDGGQHAANENDKIRDEFMEKRGIKVVRIWNNDVIKNTEGVIEYIRNILRNRIDSYRYFRLKTFSPLKGEKKREGEKSSR